MKAMAAFYERKYRLRPGSVGCDRILRHHFCYWEPDQKDPRKTRLYNYCVLSFPNVRDMKSAAKSLSDGVKIPGTEYRRYPVHERYVDPVQKMLDVMNITPSGWIQVDAWRIPDRYYTHSQIEVEAQWTSVVDRPEIDKTAPFWMCSWDIETYSFDGSFPIPKKPEDFTICINSYLKQYGRDEVIHASHHYGQVRVPEGIEVFVCDSELEVIESWRDFITLDVQPSVVLGYNVNGFDWHWLGTKVNEKCEPDTLPRLFKSGIFIDEVTKIVRKELNSNAKGDNTLEFIPMTGRLLIDMYHIIKSDHKLLSYTLSDVCEHFFGVPKDKMETTPKGRVLGALLSDVGVPLSVQGLIQRVDDAACSTPEELKKIVRELNADHGYHVETVEDPSGLKYVLTSEVSDLRKIDLPYWKIWENYDDGPETRAENIVYCDKDCEMPLKLAEKLQSIRSLVEMSRITRTPLPQMLIRGQQIKTWNQILYYCHRFDCVVNLDAVDSRDADGYEGAIVLDPVCGYYDRPVATLDFASLYPSIMQANRFCFSTLVKSKDVLSLLASICSEKREVRHEVKDKVGNRYVDGVLYDGSNKVTLSRLYEGDGVSYREIRPSPGKVNTFVQHFDGVIPRILSKLKAQRKAVRAEQRKYPEGSLQWSILECRQLNIKITANSVYGFFGAVAKGILPCVEISESVTCIGREMILQTKAYVEHDFAEYTSNEFVDSLNSRIENPKFHHPYIPQEIKDLIKGVKVIYGDTDSVMVLFEGLARSKDGVMWAHRIGKLASVYVTLKFKKHPTDDDIVLEYEKCYWPFILFKKKRYAGYLWTKCEKPDRRDAKGVEVKRRDNWLGLRKTYSECLDAMLDWRRMDLELAKRLVLTLLDDVVNDRLSLQDYVISKCLKKDYSKAKAPPPHAVVRDKKRARKPGSEPKSGNRVPFVITEDKRQKKVSLRAEDPEYAEQNRGTVHIDRLYYINTLKNPFSTLLEPCFENPEALFTDAINEINKKRNRQRDMTPWMVKRPRTSETAEGMEMDTVPEVSKTERIMRSVKRRSDDVQYVPKAIQKENKKKRKLELAQRKSIMAYMVPRKPVTDQIKREEQ
jgi:DNA polymerase elongation subunit (family B)